ncbi:glutamate ligase domain-containing protein [Fodinicurvata halophila]|uniref:glutamate ligase domain-containing protein n=1 Tax=Fodinicurvata halophila TaxID=1419723 RepID=UPI00363759A2
MLGATEPQQGGRRIAVLGDMLELGEEATRSHEALADDLTGNAVDQAFLAGPLMGALARRLPGELLGAHADTSAGLTQTLQQSVRSGDVVLVKGSLGSRMRVVVEALMAVDQPQTKQANGG